MQDGGVVAYTEDNLSSDRIERFTLSIAGEWNLEDFQVLFATVAALATTYEVLSDPPRDRSDLREALSRPRRSAASTGRAIAEASRDIRVASIRYSSPGDINLEGSGDIVRATGETIERLVLMKQKHKHLKMETELKGAEKEHFCRMADLEYAAARVDALVHVRDQLVVLGFNEDEVKLEIRKMLHALEPVETLADEGKIVAKAPRP